MQFLASLLSGLVLLQLTVAEIQPTYNPDCITDNLAFRHDYGTPFDQAASFCAMRFNQGEFIKGIEVWGDSGNPKGRFLNGIKITYTDDNSTFVGYKSGERMTPLFWDPEKTSISKAWAQIEANHQDSIGLLYIKLTDGQELKGGNPKDFEHYENWMNDNPAPENWMTSGLLMGISGRVSQNGIGQLSFHTLEKEIVDSHVHDVVFSPTTEELNAQKTNTDRGLTIRTVRNVHFINDFDEEATVTLSSDASMSHTRSFTTSVSSVWHMGMKEEFEADFTVLGTGATLTAGMDMFWETQTEKSTMEEESYPVGWQISQEIPLKPGKAVHGWVYGVEGKYDVNWMGKVTVTLDGGRTMTFPTGGTLNNVLYSEAWMHWQNETSEEANLAIRKGDGERGQVKPKSQLSVKTSGGNNTLSPKQSSGNSTRTAARMFMA